MKYTVTIYNTKHTVDEANGESHIRARCPNFFHFPFGKRHSYVFYRGCVVASSTVKFSNGISQRKHVAYIYDDNEQDTFCISADCDPSSVNQAKKIIDRVLERGSYEYGDNK